ncbi:MAG: hypothetical protein AAF909_09895 [Pseudomonadota bacterium]
MLLVASFYRFSNLDDVAALIGPLTEAGRTDGLTGMILLAEEGVNGALAGRAEAVHGMLERLRAIPGLENLTWRESWAEIAPFRKLRVRLKREIVSMGAPGLLALDGAEMRKSDAEDERGRVSAADWNAVLQDPTVPVIDVRNAYETAIGGFAGAIDPRAERFRDFPAWAAAAPELRGATRLAMYCTGGIRCEKAAAHLRRLNPDLEVLQLRGGILAYLAETPPESSLWKGGCFVFDERVALGHGLRPTGHVLCRGCRRALEPEGAGAPGHLEGVQCAHCAARTSPAQRAARQERRRQIALAAARGARHMGPASTADTGASADAAKEEP